MGWHPNLSGLHEISASSPRISPVFVPKIFMLLLSHISRVLLLRPHYFVIRSPGLNMFPHFCGLNPPACLAKLGHFQDFIPKRGQHTPYESQSRRACEKLGHCQPWWMDMRQMGVLLKMLCTPKAKGFADHYPYEKWLFHWEYSPNIFRSKPKALIPPTLTSHV